VSIGEALAQARSQAGLTLTQVSQRTRIRETIIAGIEADDYSSCGGDFYARGHIRAIARVAGIDSEPLIEEYDAARRPPPEETDEFSAPPVSGRRSRWGLGGGRGSGGGSGLSGGRGAGGASGTGHAGTGHAGHPGQGWPGEQNESGHRYDGGPSAGEPDQAYQPEPEPEPERWPGLGWLGRGHREHQTDQDDWDEQLRHHEPDLADDPERDQGPGGDWAEADLADEVGRRTDWGQQGEDDQTDPDGWRYDEQAGHRGPHQADEPQGRGGLGTWLGLGDRDSRRRRRGQIRTMWVVLAAVIGFAIYSFLFAAGHRASATGSHRSHTSVQAAARRHAGHGKSAPSPATSSPAPTTTPAVPLRPASAAAFGTGGTGQGDNPGQAGLAIDHNPATAWNTDWYTSADFGHLYQGTGLLIDMGHPVTITGAQIALGGGRGASLALRVGNSPALAGLKTAATAANAGGTVSLKPGTPARGRYVLVWLTRLPRDPAGTFQASIYNVQLTGQP
jgi:transcriptional regulator with XRE-family HTH domain